MLWWMSWNRAVTLSVSCTLWPLIVSDTVVMRWSIASSACAVPPARDDVSSEARSIEWIACAAPSVSEEVSVPRRIVDGLFGRRTCRPRVSKSSTFQRLQAAVDGLVERLDLGIERGVEIADRACSVVSNCDSRWSSVAVISPPLEPTRPSKLST